MIIEDNTEEVDLFKTALKRKELWGITTKRKTPREALTIKESDKVFEDISCIRCMSASMVKYFV